MQRRSILTATGALTATLAGCSDLDPRGSEPDPYDSEDKDAMLFGGSRAEWPDDLVRDDSINDNFDEAYTTSDEELVVMFNVEINEDIETAKDEMDKSRAKAGNDEDYPLADDAFIADDGQAAWVIFRHVNARGQSVAARQSGMEIRPDRGRASEYAERLFEHWQR